MRYNDHMTYILAIGLVMAFLGATDYYYRYLPEEEEAQRQIFREEQLRYRETQLVTRERQTFGRKRQVKP